MRKDPRSQAERDAAFERAKMEINIMGAPRKFFGPPLPRELFKLKGDRWARKSGPTEICDHYGFQTGRYFP